MNNTTNTINYLGADVSKNTIEINCPLEENKFLPSQIENTPKGHKELIKVLKKRPTGNIQVICEATGSYHREFINTLKEARIPCSVINPARMHHFAKAIGSLAKTDKIDAKVIATYGQKMTPAPDPLEDPHSQELTALLTRRTQLINMRSSEGLRLAQTHLQTAKKSIQTVLKAIEKEILRIEEAIDSVKEKSQPIQEKVALMSQVQGIGELTAMSLLSAMPELGTLKKNQAAALGGLAPFNRDSGKSQKARSIRGGRPNVRKVLYMAAVSASRCNPHLRDYYQRLKANGKKPKVALTALMRKLLIYLNSLLKKYILQQSTSCSPLPIPSSP